jgi:hypothetical protein
MNESSRLFVIYLPEEKVKGHFHAPLLLSYEKTLWLRFDNVGNLLERLTFIVVLCQACFSSFGIDKPPKEIVQTGPMQNGDGQLRTATIVPNIVATIPIKIWHVDDTGLRR